MMERRALEVCRRAAPAPERPERKSIRLPAEVHNTCVEWARWTRTRGFFGGPRPVGSVMRSFVEVRGRGDGPDARIDPDLAAFQAAIVAMGDGTARRMFEAHFLIRGLNVTAAAGQLGCSRTHWYRTVNDFAQSAYRHAFYGIGTNY